MSRAKVFEKFARGMEQRRPADAAILRRCAADAAVMDIVPEDTSWDAPHKVLAAVQYLVLKGVVADPRDHADAWSAFRGVLEAHREWIAEFVRTRNTQTNEPQRCFALLPVFLTVARTAGKPLDLLELGTSGGLNLFWDRHRYRYREGQWGPGGAELTLSGEEAQGASVLADLLRQDVEVRRRRGVDLHPIDVARDDEVRFLESFLLGDAARVDRLRRAVAVVKKEPPELVRGDYLVLLPGLLEDYDDSALTVVFQTISTIYLPLEKRRRLNALVEEAGSARPLAWISTPTPEEHRERRNDYPLELTIWPGGVKRTMARMSNSGDRLEWVG